MLARYDEVYTGNNYFSSVNVLELGIPVPLIFYNLKTLILLVQHFLTVKCAYQYAGTPLMSNDIHNALHMRIKSE